MFTGIIEEIGTIKAIRSIGGGKRIYVNCVKVLEDAQIDDSIAVNGVCLTVVERGADYFAVEAVEETLEKTSLAKLKTNSRVNLERALAVGDRLGGHITQGHVDCLGEIDEIVRKTTEISIWISYPSSFSKWVVSKGSIAVDGVSLTIAQKESSRLKIAVIPHTWKKTVLSEKNVGDKVNIEFDIIGKYVENLISSSQTDGSSESSVLNAFLEQPNL